MGHGPHSSWDSASFVLITKSVPHLGLWILTLAIAHNLIKSIHTFQLTWFWATTASEADPEAELTDAMQGSRTCFLFKSLIKMSSQAERSIEACGTSENSSFVFNNHSLHQLPLSKIVQLDNRLDFKVWKCEMTDYCHHWATDLQSHNWLPGCDNDCKDCR